MDSLAPTDLDVDARARALMPLSGSYLLDQVANGMAGMDARDALLIMAINQANIAPLTRDPEARRRYGGLESPAADEERRPAHLSAIASSLRLPYETVRRRARRLELQGACVLTPHGAVVPESFLASPAYLTSVVAAHARLHRFYQEVRAAGLMRPLPASRFPPEPMVPIRASLRLIADYLLRTGDVVMGLTGDLICGLAFLGILSGGESLPAPPTSTSVLARRLAIPHETVRRHCAELVSNGWCVRAGRGYAVAPETLARSETAAFIRGNAANVHRLFSALAERGLVEAWERLGAPSAPQA
jgi:DNA-binding IclR family transcriptional regulator